MNESWQIALASSVILGFIGLLGFLGKRYFDSVVEGLSGQINNSKEERNVQHADLKEDVVEIKSDVKELSNKVSIQNGRVGKLENWKDQHLKDGEYFKKDFDRVIDEIKKQLKPSRTTKRR